jgi:CheY-like chemotaxis protein
LERKYKILLAEDEIAVSRLLRRYLEKVGFEVLAAANGLEALDLFRRENPDLLLSDIDMPEMDGLELLARIREVNRRLPAILVSGKAEPESGAQERDYRFMAKPLSLIDLRQQIELAIAS